LTILIDDRSGSAELYHIFPSGVPIELRRMEFGDFAFLGNGGDGPTFIGIERKAVRDLLNSITTGRLSGHQLVGLLDTYSWVYLIVEGMWRFNPTNGLLEDRRGNSWCPISLGSRRFMAREMLGYLNTLAVRAGVIVLYSKDKMETVHIIVSIYRWWQKEWKDHSSHLARNKIPIKVSLVRPSMVRRMAAELPGVGWGKSAAVAERFPNMVELAGATIKEWSSIPGIGKKLSQKIVKSLKGEE